MPSQPGMAWRPVSKHCALQLFLLLPVHATMLSIPNMPSYLPSLPLFPLRHCIAGRSFCMEGEGGQDWFELGMAWDIV